MAIREIREIGDPILEKHSKPVTEMTPRIRQLIDDMWDTMRQADGVGLAAVQVGVLKRIFIVQTDEDHAYTLINPEITFMEGEQVGNEGCLSVPDKSGQVKHAMKVALKALDENMQPVEITGEELLARAFQHEYDHLDGKLYVDLVEGDLESVEDDEE